MTREDLVAELLAERHNGTGWRTPGWEPAPPKSEGFTARKRRQQMEAEAREYERRNAG